MCFLDSDEGCSLVLLKTTKLMVNTVTKNTYIFITKYC